MNDYIFTSARLGFRNWTATDLPKLQTINSNEEVMRFFPSTQTEQHTADFITRMQEQYAKTQFCYFAVEIITTKELIGFIGLSEQTYEADFNPSIDIGWRLDPKFWGRGYASEGASQCLTYAFDVLQLDQIVSVAPTVNLPSIGVMQKIGMKFVKEFKHPLLPDFPQIESCVLYEICNK